MQYFGNFGRNTKKKTVFMLLYSIPESFLLWLDIPSLFLHTGPEVCCLSLEAGRV